MTSHDVVARIRRLAGQRRVGHAGTLDPLATGVLVVCLGQATRVSEYLTQHDKEYEALVRLGQTTDTYDAEGKITGQYAGDLPTLGTIEAILPQFRGWIEQRPPAYSAVKVGGEPLYRRARRGEIVETESRRVHIARLEAMRWEPPFVTLAVECSAGAYVRSLAHDIGGMLGCGAYLAGLRRTRSGHFTLADAVPLGDLEGEAEGGLWRRWLLPLDAGLADFDALEMGEEETRSLAFGQGVDGPPPRRGYLAKAYSPAGELTAVVWFDETQQIWRPKKVFALQR